MKKTISKDYDRFWCNAFWRHFDIKTPEPLSDWADKHRVISAAGGAEPGRWRTSRTPYLRKIMDAATDISTRQIVFCSGVQLGKTELLLNAICYYMLHDPCPVMLVEPSDDLVRDIGCDRIDTMIYATPELQPLFGVDARGKKSTKTGRLKLDMKRFPGGYLKLASANAPSDLVSRSIRVVLCDEIDKYPTNDGSVVDKAKGRTSNFSNSKLILTSSPGTIQGSEIWRRLNDTAQYEYRIPCPCCGEYIAWTWDMVKWKKLDTGAIDQESVCMLCPHCNGKIRGAGAAPDSLLALGEWTLKSGDPCCGRLGFRLPSLYSPWMTLREMAEEWHMAHETRDIDRLRVFIQDRLAEPWDDRPAPWAGKTRTVTKSRFDRAIDHSKIRFVTAGIDVQGDRIECSVWGYAPSRESWIIEHKIFHGDPILEDTWSAVTDYLTTPLQLADGRIGEIQAACVDSGDGASTATVYRFCRGLESRNVVAIKGRGGATVAPVSQPSRSNIAKCLLYTLGVDKLKKTIVDRLAIQTRGPGFIHVPEQLSGEFWKQLNAEALESVVENGKTVQKWKKVRARNEALDCCVYAYAAYMIFGAGKNLDVTPPKPRTSRGRKVKFNH